MKVPRSLLLALFLGSPATTGVAQDSQVPPAAEPPSPEPLVQDLSSEKFTVREKASQQLWKLGEPAIPFLEKAASGADPEAAFRANDLLRNIRHGILPDTSPAISALVERYLDAKPEDKPRIIAELGKEQAALQILKLYASETDPQIRAEMAADIHVVALNAAREMIQKDQPEEALKYLELAPRNHRSLLAIASFHRTNGTLAAEIERAKDGPADWKLALARISGDLPGAIAAANELGDPLQISTLQLLSGDPLPWLELKKKTGGLSPSRSLYLDQAIANWKDGAAAGDEAIRQLDRLVTEARDEQTSSAALAALFILGRPDLAETHFAAEPAADVAVYFSSVERPAEALRAFKLDPSLKNLNEWVEKQFSIYLHRSRFENNRIELESAQAGDDLLQLARHLSQYGLHDELVSAYEKPLLDLAEEDEETFHTFLASLFPANGISSRLGRGIGIKWAGKDEERWRLLVGTAFGDDERAAAWWDWTSALDPAATLVQRFDALLTLFRLSPDPQHLRERWLKLSWKAVENSPQPIQKTNYLKRIQHVSDPVAFGQYTRSADARTFIKVLDQLDESDRPDPLTSQSYLSLSALDRWEEVAQIFRDLLSPSGKNINFGSSPFLHAYLATSLRRAGNPNEAAKHDTLLEKLYLGDPDVAGQVAAAYAFGGEFERVATWKKRAAFESLSGDRFHSAHLAQYGALLLERAENWKVSAALAEAAACEASENDIKVSDAVHFLEFRLKADLARGLSLLESDREYALKLIRGSHALFPGCGLLADYFFPSLRTAGLTAEHDELFEKSWKIYANLITTYPKSERLRNGAAWTASRAVRRLDEAEKHSTEALRLDPNQAAYLDTMAEVHFAKRNRKAAIRWSTKSINFSPREDMIRSQHERFIREPFPPH